MRQELPASRARTVVLWMGVWPPASSASSKAGRRSPASSTGRSEPFSGGNALRICPSADTCIYRSPRCTRTSMSSRTGCRDALPMLSLDEAPIDVGMPDARTLYEMSRVHWNRWTRDGFRQNINLGRAALQRDPNYAPACALLGLAYARRSSYGFDLPESDVRRARESLTVALAWTRTSRRPMPRSPTFIFANPRRPRRGVTHRRGTIPSAAPRSSLSISECPTVQSRSRQAHRAPPRRCAHQAGRLRGHL